MSTLESVPLQRALALAFRRLNRRETTAHEMRCLLERAEIAPAAIDAAMVELGAGGYVDDARYVRLFVEDRRTLDGWGLGRIRRTLAARGVPRELVDEVLSSDPGDPDGEQEEARALAVLRRRFSQPPEDRRDRERALGMLMRKGYSVEIAARAIDVHRRGS